MANETETKLRPRFRSGHIVATHGALDLLQGDERLAALFLARHLSGDSGDTCDEDKAINEDAIQHGARVMSVYKLIGGRVLWIMTEADRSVTTFLLPEEY
jgi:hypothetical protein